MHVLLLSRVSTLNLPQGPFTRAIFVAILGRFSSSDGCEGVDEL
jgi:hypothetical protein